MWVRQVFKQHANALVRLKQLFPYHVISSMGTITEVQQEIKKELRCGHDIRLPIFQEYDVKT